MTQVGAMWRSFSADDWWYIGGRGWVAGVKCPVLWVKQDGFPAGMAPGDEVLIDGRLYRLLGIESYATMEIPDGWPIGLLVEPA